MEFIISLNPFKTETPQAPAINTCMLCTKGQRVMTLCRLGDKKTIYAQIEVHCYCFDEVFYFKCKNIGVSTARSSGSGVGGVYPVLSEQS